MTATRQQLESRAINGLVVLLSVMIVGAGYLRLEKGIDLSDESLYVAMARHLLMGGRPFLDEINFSQTASLLSVPVLALKPSGLDGAVLWMRRGYFFFTCGVAGTLAWSLRRVFDARVAALLGLWAVAFVPFSISNFSYNTVGLGMFTIGSALVFACTVGKASVRLLALAGIAHGLAVAGRASFLGGVLAQLLVLVWLHWRASDRRPAGFYLGGVLPIAALGLILVLTSGVENVMASIDYMRSLGAGSPSLDRWVTSSFRIWPGVVGSTKMSLAVVFVAGCIGLLALLRPDTRSRTTLLAVGLPSLIAGLLISLESTNGMLVLGIGLFPAAVFGFAFLPRPWLPALLVLGLLGWAQRAVYRDAPLAELDTVVSEGAFAGIATTESKRALLRDLSRDLHEIATPLGRPTVLFYDRFPAGYLIADLPPAGNTAWLFQLEKRPRLTREHLVEYFERIGERPEIIVRMETVPHFEARPEVLRYPVDDAIERLVRSTAYDEVLARPAYRVYRRTAGS